MVGKRACRRSPSPRSLARLQADRPRSEPPECERSRTIGPRQIVASRALMLAAILGFGSACASAPLMEDPVVQMPVAAPRDDPELDNVCHLWIRRQAALVFRPKFTGSAVLYRGRYLLTAGHNVYQDRSSIRGMDVRCGVADARAEPASETIEPWQAMDAAGFDGNGFARDFGVIRLRHAIGSRRPITLAGTPAGEGQPVRFAGYPGGPHDGWHMYSAEARITATNGALSSYDVETFRSNSGGPVWRRTAHGPELVAIHVSPSTGRTVDAGYRREVERLIAELDRRAAAHGF